MSWLGLDIGGANLKASDGRAWSQSLPFPLWRDPAGLAAALRKLIADAPCLDDSSTGFAVTMTGELCDCFRTKAEGVRHILGAMREVARRREIRVYLVDGTFGDVELAAEKWQLAAASNWHALGSFACRYTASRQGLLIDVGSTTTDIVPIVDGKVATPSRTDTERLAAGELVYMGVGRTPVCAVVRDLPWREFICPVAAELFATTADAYLLLDHVAETEDAPSAADGRALTKRFARERLGRMLCADRSEFSEEDALSAAAHIRDHQCRALADALERVKSRLSDSEPAMILSGAGEFLARHLLAESGFTGRAISLAERIGPCASSCAPAYSVAVLASEEAAS